MITYFAFCILLEAFKIWNRELYQFSFLIYVISISILLFLMGNYQLFVLF